MDKKNEPKQHYILELDEENHRLLSQLMPLAIDRWGSVPSGLSVCFWCKSFSACVGELCKAVLMGESGADTEDMIAAILVNLFCVSLNAFRWLVRYNRGELDVCE